MESLVDEGRCGAIGLSDVTLEKVQEIFATARIKPAVVQVESHPYLPEWELLEFCQEHGIVLLAFAPLGHASKPNVLEDPVITAIAARLDMTPAQVALSWAVQRGTALLTTSTKPQRIAENFEISPLPEEAMSEMRNSITTNIRFNTVVHSGVPGFIPPALLTPSRPENKTIGNERERAGTRRSESAGEPAFCLVKTGFDSPWLHHIRAGQGL